VRTRSKPSFFEAGSSILSTASLLVEFVSGVIRCSSTVRPPTFTLVMFVDWRASARCEVTGELLTEISSWGTAMFMVGDF